jgi:hypothetical protein
MRTRYIVVAREPRIILIYILNISGHQKCLACKECFLKHHVLSSQARHPIPSSSAILLFFPALIKSLKWTFRNLDILLL